jgi:hypothetical protein
MQRTRIDTNHQFCEMKQCGQFSQREISAKKIDLVRILGALPYQNSLSPFTGRTCYHNGPPLLNQPISQSDPIFNLPDLGSPTAEWKQAGNRQTDSELIQSGADFSLFFSSRWEERTYCARSLNTEQIGRLETGVNCMSADVPAMEDLMCQKWKIPPSDFDPGIGDLKKKVTATPPLEVDSQIKPLPSQAPYQP